MLQLQTQPLEQLLVLGEVAHLFQHHVGEQKVLLEGSVEKLLELQVRQLFLF